MANELSRLSGYYDRKTAHDMDYRGYMEKQAMVKDIGTAIQRSTDQQMIMTGMVGADITHRIDQSTERLEQSMVCMQTGIQTSIKAQTYAIVASQAALAHTFNQGFDRINNTLDMGFSGISSQLGSMTAAFSTGLTRIADNLKQMSKDICDRLDAIHDIVNNPLLTQSRELYRRSAVNYNKEFYEEALEDIKSAVEKNKTDYISWFHLGKVYLFGASEFSNVIDLEKAIEALTTAGKYIKPDMAESNDAKLMAAEIWFYIGLAKYNRFNDLNHNNKEAEAQEMIKGALEAFDRSWSLSENMFESLYNIARCKVIMGNTADAIKDIETVITKDKGYAIKAVDDNDFETITDDIYKLIESMKKAIFPKAKENFEALKLKVADTVFIGGSFADLVKNLVDEYMTETFTEDMPYFDIRDGYEMFPVILEYLNMEEYPCDRLVAELMPKDCPYSNNYKEEGKHPFGLNFFYGKLFNNSLICWSGVDWESTRGYDYSDKKFNELYAQNEKINQLKEKYGITDGGYPRLLTYKYTSIATPGIIEFSLPTDELLQKVKCRPQDSNEYSKFLFAYLENINEKTNIDIAGIKSRIGINTVIDNNNEYNSSLWRFTVKWDITKPSSKDNHGEDCSSQEFGIAYSKNEKFFIPICSITAKFDKNNIKQGSKDEIFFITPVVFFQDKETLILFPENRTEPIKVFQPGIMSKSVVEKAEQEAKEKAEREAEAARKAKADQEAKEAVTRQRRQWIAQGLCRYCGGKLGGVFTKKCKSCGREN